MGLTAITVTGHLVTADNQGISGQVEFALLEELRDSASHTVVPPGVIVRRGLAGGSLSGATVLWASDDVGVNPPGGTRYRLRIRPTGAASYDKYFVLPHTAAGGSFDLSQIPA